MNFTKIDIMVIFKKIVILASFFLLIKVEAFSQNRNYSYMSLVSFKNSFALKENYSSGGLYDNVLNRSIGSVGTRYFIFDNKNIDILLNGLKKGNEWAKINKTEKMTFNKIISTSNILVQDNDKRGFSGIKIIYEGKGGEEDSLIILLKYLTYGANKSSLLEIHTDEIASYTNQIQKILDDMKNVDAIFKN